MICFPSLKNMKLIRFRFECLRTSGLIINISGKAIVFPYDYGMDMTYYSLPSNSVKNHLVKTYYPFSYHY